MSNFIIICVPADCLALLGGRQSSDDQILSGILKKKHVSY